MAIWEWSHSLDAYEDARLNLTELPRSELEVIWAEWQADRTPKDSVLISRKYLDLKRYEEALVRAKDLPTDGLVYTIWESAFRQSRCTRGGHFAWMCPFGCDMHKVPFDRE